MSPISSHYANWTHPAAGLADAKGPSAMARPLRNGSASTVPSRAKEAANARPTAGRGPVATEGVNGSQAPS